MSVIPNYTLTEKIYEGLKVAVYRGKEDSSQRPVIIKLLKVNHPTVKDIAKLKREYEIAQALDLEGIIKAYRLEKYDTSVALILEDFGGDSLKNFISANQINLLKFLKIAIQLTEIIGELHQKNIIHKDIKPQNIIIHPQTSQVKVADFSIASALSRENQTISSPNLIEGTLAYMSPEQTGRMNRAIDYRTDFYSLGITFYEVLTNQLPFTTLDPLELVHCHIAKTPTPPDQINKQIPQAISAIVMKLLSKIAEDRYQSAYGIKADLEICLKALQDTGKIETFVLGQQDVSTRFQIPQKLYGRQPEIENLLTAFERVSQGKTEIMLVAGYSGIGKSALVNEIHKPIVRKKGYFVSGKFDQFKRNIPYSSFIQAFQELTRQILTESEAQIQVWKEKILTALGANGKVITDVIPEIELIIGPQIPLPQLGASESQNRFNLVLQQFLSVFAQTEHPLVLFLDDLQWADTASLKLLQLLMSNSEEQCLLLIGAYRDNEVTPTHALTVTLEDIQKTGAVINTITLKPLVISDINQLLSETLHCSLTKTQSLAELLFRKTHGNPFFLTQMLLALHQEQLLIYSLETGGWQWNLAQLQDMAITDNVVELMVNKLQKLSTTAQIALKLAACIGNNFDLNLLAIVSEKSLSETAADLWETMQVGLVLPIGGDYKLALMDEEAAIADSNQGLAIKYRFLHDRVQQAAYSLIPEQLKKETHLKVGQLLLQHTKPTEQDERIFDIVNQLNIGADLITCLSTRYELAKLNLTAARKAKAATAYEPAIKYLSTGLGLLSNDCWQSHYDLALDLYIESVEVEYLNTNFDRAEKMAEIVLENAQDLLQKSKVYQTKIYFQIAQNQMSAAIATSLQTLAMLGEGLITSAPNVDVIEDLINLPEMTDRHKLAAMQVLLAMITPCLNTRPDLLPSIAFTLVNLSQKYGNSSFAAAGYGFYGLILCGGLSDIDSGYRFGQLSLKVLERFYAREFEAKVSNMFNVFVRHWKEPAQTTIKPLLAGIQAGIETGDLEYACYNATSYCNYLFFVGEPLAEVSQQQSKYIEFLINLKQEYQIYFAQITRQLALNLMGEVEEHSQLIGESFDESKMIPIFLETNMGTLLFLSYLAKTILLYFLRDYQQAAAFAQKAESYQGNMVGFMQFVEYNFYYSLCLLAVYSQATLAEQDQLLAKVESNQVHLQKWASHAPANYQHKYDLVEAEKAKILGQDLQAMQHYDRAIQGGREQGYLHEEALACELAAEFYWSRGLGKIAFVYLTDAYHAYVQWGALTKVRELEAKYPQLLSRLPADTARAGRTQTTTSSTIIDDISILDLNTIIKASQAIASEIVLSSLLDKLLKIVMENAGAQTSCLILAKADQLVIEAVGDVERSEINLCQSVPISISQQLPISVVNYAARTQENVILVDATQQGPFTQDPYIIRNRPKSILCTPIINKGKLIGLLYLENNLTTGAFTHDRLEVLRLLSSQAAISLENALLYSDLQAATHNLKQANVQLEDYSRTLEHKVETRTLELKEKNNQLEQTLQQLKQTQTQLIQTEKMSSLGQLVAGIAHEINNPVNFIHGNLIHASNYTEDLLKLVQLYQEQYPTPTDQVQAQAEEMDLEFITKDLPKLLSSMHVGAERIRQIVLSLRNFSRLDEADMKPVDIHEGIDSTLLILQHRLQKRGEFSLQIVKQYGNLPLVECYAGQMNQVLMNVISNAIDALEESYRQQTTQPKNIQQLEDNSLEPNTIQIYTEAINHDWVRIRIADNGPGMNEEVRRKLFDPFFTTKPVGSGTGLGLSISYQIVVEKHGGRFECLSQVGAGAEFIIEIPVSQSKGNLSRSYAA